MEKLSAATTAQLEAMLEESRTLFADLGERHRGLTDSGGGWPDRTAAQRGQRLLQERSELQAQMAAIRAELAERPVPRAEPVRHIDDLSPWERFAAFGHARLSAEEIKDHGSGLVSPEARRGDGFRLPTASLFRAATTDAGAASPDQVPGLVPRLEGFGRVAQVSRQFVQPFSTDARVSILDDTSHEGESLAITATATADDLSQFQTAAFFARKGSSKQMAIHRYAERDIRAFSAAAAIERAARVRIGKAINKELTTGAGTGARPLPLGVVPCAAVSARTASSTEFTAQEIAAMPFSVDFDYRYGSQGGRFDYIRDGMGGMRGYMMSSAAEKRLQEFEDSQKRPLRLPAMQEGQPDTWNGWPLYFNPDMADAAADAKPVLFGNFGVFGVWIADEIEVIRTFSSQDAEADIARYIVFAFYDAIPVSGRTDDGTGDRSTFRTDGLLALQMKSA